MISAWRSWGLNVTCILVLAGAVTTASVLAEQLRPMGERSEEMGYLPKGEHLKVAVLGYRHITADLIWMKAVQYFGDMKQTTKGFKWAYHATDVVTDLDPDFVLAYQAGGTILGVWSGLMDESIALLQKGMRNRPNDWRFPFLIGYDYFYELCDAANGAKYFQLAATLPGAPPYLPKLAARLAAESGDPEAAIEFLVRFSKQVGDRRVKEALDVRIRELVIERDVRIIDEAVWRFKSQEGRMPLTLDELVERKLLESVPKEPFGGRYLLSPSGGAASSELKERLRAFRKVGCANKPTLALS